MGLPHYLDGSIHRSKLIQLSTKNEGVALYINYASNIIAENGTSES